MKILGNYLTIMLLISLFISVVFCIQKNSEINGLRRDIGCYQIGRDTMEAEMKDSLILQKITIWYIVNDRTISSLPDGKGECVNLGNTPLRSIGNRFSIKHPDHNRKVTFFPSESRTGAYTVKGGWLTYQYLD